VKDRELFHPEAADISLDAILGALSAPIRRDVLRRIASEGALYCGDLSYDVVKSTMSHHFRVLRESGLMHTEREGKHRRITRRDDVIEQRFPGLLAAVGLPVLRKDFIIDEYQVYQARAWGADAILLIAAALDAERLERFEQTAHSLNMTVLLELHERGELEKCRNLTTPLWGVNNRNLRTFEVSLQQTLDLLPDLAGKTVVTESGIRNKDDVGYMRARGVHTFLIGETFMRADDIEAEVRKLF